MVGKTYNLPTSCPCRNKFDLRDLTANMMSELCKDTEIEPKLIPFPGEKLEGRTSNNSNEARVDSGLTVSGSEGNRHFPT